MTWEKYLKVVFDLLPAGVMGTSMALGATLPAEAASRAPLASPGSIESVADRIASIQKAVSVTIDPLPQQTPDPNVQLVWGNRWANIGGGPGGWRNIGWNGNRWNNFQPRWNNFRPRWNNWSNAWRNW